MPSEREAHWIFPADPEAEDELREGVKDDPVVVRACRIGRQKDDADEDDSLQARSHE